MVTGARHGDRMTPHLKDLHWLPIPYRIDFKVAVLTYRCLNGCAPSYSTNVVSLRNSNRGTRVLRSSTAPSTLYDLVPPSIHLKKDGMRPFSSYAPTIGNNLPISDQSSPSLPRFCSALKRHYFIDAFLTQ